MTLPALATISSAAWPISRTVERSAGGTAERRVAAPGDLGDVHGVVAHALEVGDHAQRRDEHPQVAGDRLLAGQQVEGPRLDLAVERVDAPRRR